MPSVGFLMIAIGFWQSLNRSCFFSDIDTISRPYFGLRGQDINGTLSFPQQSQEKFHLHDNLMIPGPAFSLPYDEIWSSNSPIQYKSLRDPTQKWTNGPNILNGSIFRSSQYESKDAAPFLQVPKIPRQDSPQCYKEQTQNMIMSYIASLFSSLMKSPNMLNGFQDFQPSILLGQPFPPTMMNIVQFDKNFDQD